MLSVIDLSVQFNGKQTLNKITFHVSNHDLVIFSGKNGCGKSTLIKALMGLVIPNSGTITLDNTSILGMTPFHIREHGLRYLPQTAPVFPDLTVKQNLGISQFATDDSLEGWDDIYRAFNFESMLSGFINKKAGLLSKGQRQLLALAMTFRKYAKVFLLDEPFAPLTIEIKEALGNKMKEIAQKVNTGYLIVEHEKGVTKKIGNKFYDLIIENDGSVLKESYSNV